MCLLVAGQWAKWSVSSTGRMLSKSRAKSAWWLFPLLWWQVGHACTESICVSGTGSMLSKSAWWLPPLLWWQVGHAWTEGVKSICPFYKILANSMRQY